MELIQTLIEEKLRNNVDYIFCLDVDSKFHGHWGAETLGHLVAVIHPGMDCGPTYILDMYGTPMSGGLPPGRLLPMVRATSTTAGGRSGAA